MDESENYRMLSSLRITNWVALLSSLRVSLS